MFGVVGTIGTGARFICFRCFLPRSCPFAIEEASLRTLLAGKSLGRGCCYWPRWNDTDMASTKDPPFDRRCEHGVERIEVRVFQVNRFGTHRGMLGSGSGLSRSEFD
jgi:hypothetical protein